MQYLLIILLNFISLVNAENQDIKKIQFEEGLDKYQNEAVLSLSNSIISDFESYLLDSHFVYGPNKQNSIVPCENNKKKCRHNINYSLDFSAASIDLNNDGIDEVLVQFENANQCGPTGPCYTDILYKDEDTWIFIGDGTNDLRGSNLYVSNKYKNGYQTIFYNGKSRWSEKEDKFISNKYKCEFKKVAYECAILVKKKK